MQKSNLIFIDVLLSRIYKKYSQEFIIGLYEDVMLEDIKSDDKLYLKRLMNIVEKYKLKDIRIYGHFNVGGFKLDLVDIRNSVSRILANELYDFLHLPIGTFCDRIRRLK